MHATVNDSAALSQLIPRMVGCYRACNRTTIDT
jgi:hypothetical protein